MVDQKKKVLIIGGGITGLSTAFYTQQYLKAQGIEGEITLVEKSDRLGGKINTLYRDNFVIEKGPDSFLARKMPMIDLARELGIEDQLTGTNAAAKKNYILLHNKLHLMPPGLVLGIPTKWLPFAKTGLISLKGKVRAALDLVLPARKSSGDESLGHFLERRLGSEVREHMAEPLLGGIYAGDPRTLSLQATFPQFAQLEKKHGSLIRGMMESRKHPVVPANTPEVAKNSIFLTFKRGLTGLLDALIPALYQTRLLTGLGVVGIHKHKETKQYPYEITLDNGEVLDADVVIVTAPASVAAKLLQETVPAAQHLEHIQYVSVGNVIMAFDRKQIDHPLDGSGFVVPRKEGRHITACTWTSSKWVHTSPTDKVLLRCYIGRSGEEAIVSESDEVILAKVRKDIQELMGISAEPLFYEITRLHHSMPQYPVGHLELIGEVRSQLAEHMPGVYVTGAAFEGVGLPDCIRQGRDTAKQAVEGLRSLL